MFGDVFRALAKEVELWQVKLRPVVRTKAIQSVFINRKHSTRNRAIADHGFLLPLCD